MTPHFFLPFQKKTNTTIPRDYPILNPHEIAKKQKNCHDAVTFFKMWATLFFFTFLFISVPYHNKILKEKIDFII
jgi:hypothetical protein